VQRRAAAESPPAGHAITHRTRVLLSGVIIGVAAATLGVATWSIGHLGDGPELACRFYPNAVVPLNVSSPLADCPLERHDRVLRVRVPGGDWHDVRRADDIRAAVDAHGAPVDIEVRRNGHDFVTQLSAYTPAWQFVVGPLGWAALISLLLVTCALVIVWSSNAPAAPVLGAYTVCAVVNVTWTLAGYQRAELLFWPMYVTATLWPAVINHLTFVLPNPLDVGRRHPWLLRGPYALQLAGLVVSIALFERDPDTWIVMTRWLYPTALAFTVPLLVRCYRTLRSTHARLERTRATTLLWGIGIAASASTVVMLNVDTHLYGNLLPFLEASFVMVPLLVAYAIARYELFGLGVDVRQTLARLLYLGAVAGAVSAVASIGRWTFGVPLPFRHESALFAVVFVSLFLSEFVRARLWGRIERWITPDVRHLSHLEQEFATTIGHLTEPSTCEHLLARVIRSGIGARSVVIAYRIDEQLAPSHQLGEAPALTPSDWATLAGVPLPEGVRRLDADLLVEEPLRRVASLGVEALVEFSTSGGTRGLVLLGLRHSGDPYTRVDLRFAQAVCAQAAVAIHNARLAQALVAAERFATVGRMKANLAHDLGKPLGVLELLARRLRDRVDSSDPESKDVHTIAQLTGDLRHILRSVLADEDGMPPRGHMDTALVGPMVERAVDAVSRRHKALRIEIDMPPQLPAVRGHTDTLARALANVLENAALAADRGTVHVVTSAQNGTVRIAVTDEGGGMEPSAVRHAFDPFYTARPADRGGGHGLGLSIAREIVESVGGRIALRSTPRIGTTVEIDVPVASDPEPSQASTTRE